MPNSWVARRKRLRKPKELLVDVVAQPATPGTARDTKCTRKSQNASGTHVCRRRSTPDVQGLEKQNETSVQELNTVKSDTFHGTMLIAHLVRFAHSNEGCACDLRPSLRRNDIALEAARSAKV